MKQEIKERIEQINNSIVPKGYKKTKIGIIPIDWDIADLGLLISESKELSNDINKYKVFSSSRNGLIPQNDYYNRESVETNNGYKIVPNGFVTYRHMSDDDVFHFNVNTTGASVLVSSEYPVFCSTENSCLGFLVPCLNHSARFRYYCKLQKKGGTRTRLYYNILCKYTIAHPKIEEQEKIAEMLSAQDKVIELKEKLIEQKKTKKKYICQVIIERENKTEKVYLNSYIEEVISRNNKLLINNVLSVNNQLGFVSQSEQFGKSVASKDTSNYKVVSYMDIAYNPSRINVGSVALRTEHEKGIVSPMYNVFHTTEGLLPQYLMYFFATNTFYQQMKRVLSGSVRDSLSLYDLGQIEIALPSKEKQQIIINVLGACDKEIKLLEQELEQEKQKKKALMQLLLTGIVRVKND